MTLDKLREAWHARPFRPFVLHLADGRRIQVHHPEFLAASPSGRTVVVEHLDDTTSFVDLLLVTEIEIGRPGRRGRPRR